MTAQIDVATITERYETGRVQAHGVLREEFTAQVDPETGAISPESARELTERIKQAAHALWQLITKAYQGRAWAALGYESWDAYCSIEFGSVRIRLPREERQEVIGSLRDAGLSTRAIAAAAGVARNTVKKDLRQVGHFDPPESKDATQKGGGNDGTASEGDAGSDSEPTRATGPLDAASSDGPHGHDVGRPVPEPPPAATSPEPEPDPQPARVTGIDGKSYAATREPEHAAEDAELNKTVGKVIGQHLPELGENEACRTAAKAIRRALKTLDGIEPDAAAKGDLREADGLPINGEADALYLWLRAFRRARSGLGVVRGDGDGR